MLLCSDAFVAVCKSNAWRDKIFPNWESLEYRTTDNRISNAIPSCEVTQWAVERTWILWWVGLVSTSLVRSNCNRHTSHSAFIRCTCRRSWTLSKHHHRRHHQHYHLRFRAIAVISDVAHKDNATFTDSVKWMEIERNLSNSALNTKCRRMLSHVSNIFMSNACVCVSQLILCGLQCPRLRCVCSALKFFPTFVGECVVNWISVHIDSSIFIGSKFLGWR